LNSVASSAILPSKTRILLYRICGLNIKKGAFMHPKSIFNGIEVEIGENTFINYNCTFKNQDLIIIGKNCSVKMEVMFCTATHELGTTDKRAGKVKGIPIIINDGCWIGSRATILAGVTIGSGCIVGAGSLVTKDCEPNGLYVGIPAKRIKDI
jgi:maltose O-acetyltransferase